jgi:hypothetical protein
MHRRPQWVLGVPLESQWGREEGPNCTVQGYREMLSLRMWRSSSVGGVMSTLSELEAEAEVELLLPGVLVPPNMNVSIRKFRKLPADGNCLATGTPRRRCSNFAFVIQGNPGALRI